MILDKIENADLYYDSVPGLERFMQFYNDNDLDNFPAGKIRLDGDDLFINVNDIRLRQSKDCPLEAHRDYIDIQVPMSGNEIMGWRSLADCERQTAEYDEGKDMELYSDDSTAEFVVPVGHFAVFFPTDAHRPGIGAEGLPLRKLIVKTKVEG